MPFRPRKKKQRQGKNHRCKRCGGQVRRHIAVQEVLRSTEIMTPAPLATLSPICERKDNVAAALVIIGEQRTGADMAGMLAEDFVPPGQPLVRVAVGKHPNGELILQFGIVGRLGERALKSVGLAQFDLHAVDLALFGVGVRTTVEA